MARRTPYVAGTVLVTHDGALNGIEVGSAAWYAWLEEATTFTFRSAEGSFTARKERSEPSGWYWKAYRKQAGVLHRVYLGKSAALSLDRLATAAHKLAQRIASLVPEATSAARQVLASAHDETFSTTTPSPGQLLTTKLYAPPVRSGLVARPRLTNRLQAGLAGKLTLIAAPAGFGKTTLVNAWHATTPNTLLAWVALDAADNDPVRFWSYVITALGSQYVGVGVGALAQFHSPQPPRIEAILTTLLNTLSTWTIDVVLVLDDYHLIDAPAIHQALTFLLEHLPPRLHLVIITRAEPPVSLSRLRARGELTELRAADLRFTPDEAGTFLTETMKLPLSTEAVAALETRTEGWIAGLQFAALAMRDRNDRTDFIAAFTGSNRFVLDYLAEEVLLQLPSHLQTFLLQTAVLDRMCGPICDAMLLDEQSGPHHTANQTLLEELERANLFIIPLDDTRQWYRYHHLFADVLRKRLLSSMPTEHVAALHRRASAWFEAQGLVAEAVQHALAASDEDRAARLIELHGDAIWTRGELTTLLGWLSAIPDVAYETHPKLALQHAFILVTFDDFALSERRLAAAERTLRAAPMPDTALLGQAAVIRAIIALQADEPAAVTIAAGRQALDVLPTSSASWRGLAGLILSVGYYAQAGNLTLGLQTLVEAEQAALRAGDPFTAINASTHRTIGLEIGGRLRELEQLNRGYLQRAAEPFWQGVPFAGYAHFGLSRALYERNQLLAAREHLNQATAQLEAWSLKRPIINTYVLLARVHQALGEPEQAGAWMDRAVAMVQKENLKQTFSQWEAERARMYLAQNNLSAVLDWAREVESTTTGALNPVREFDHIVLAQVYLAQHRPDDAERLLARLLPAAEAAGRMGRVIAMCVLQALAANPLGNEAEALATLEYALTLAEPEGYVRTFVDQGAPIRALLRRIVQRGTAQVYVQRLLAAFPESDKAVPWRGELEMAIHGSSVVPALREPLSPRELEVLRQIAEGHSNQVIADTLVIAVSTVKRHINNIYGKLGVRSRTQALVRARELRLL